MKKRNETIRMLVLSAMFAALCCVTTMLVQFPTVAGYTNIGEGMCLLAGLVLGPWYGFFAAGIGSGLADLLAGYAHYVPGTFIIKGLVALVAALLKKGEKIPFWRLALIELPSEVIMVAGYFGYKALILGKGLAAAASIPNNLVTHKRLGYLTMLGMLKGENEYTYPPYNEVQARELIDCLRGIAPYVVIDCGSYIANDILSAVALMEADSVLRLANADLKSISYLSSQLPLLRDAKWDADKQYKTASNVKPQQAGDHMSQALGTVAFTLPHSAELEGQYLAGNLLADLSMKDSRVFRKEIEKIAREVFGC